MASIAATQSSSDFAEVAPMAPPVVTPMWATMMSAPARVMARGLVGVEDVGRGQEVERVGGGDHVDLEAVAHAGLLEGGAHGAVEEADGREVLHAGEAHGLQLGEERVA